MVRLYRDQATAIYRASWLALLLAMLATALEPTLAQSPPTASSARVSGTQLTIQFSESLTSSSTAVATDFTVNLGSAARAVSSASVSGGNVVLTLGSAVPDVDCTSDGVTVGYTATGSTLTGSGGGTVAAFSNRTVTNNTDVAPAVESIETDTTGQYVYVTFCEAITDISFQWSDFSAFAVSVNDTGQSINDLVTPSATPGRLELQLGSKAISQGDEVTLAYDQSSADESYPLQDLDQGGKLVESWLADDHEVTNNVDDPPDLVSVTALWDVITLTYSEALDENSVPDTSAFAISDKPYVVTIDSVAVSGKTVTLATSGVIRGNLEPQFQLRYTAPSDSPLQQADGKKDAPDFFGELVVSSTPTTKPVFQSAAVNGAALTITFDLPLKNVAGASAFAVGGVTGVSVSSTSYRGKVVTLTLSSAVSASDSVTIAYTKPNNPPRIEARNIKDADTFAAKSVTNNTPDPTPTFSSASIDAAGGTLTITMTKNLLTTTAGIPAKSAFAITGGSAAVSAVAVNGKTVSLTLSPKADQGDTITIAYTKPTGANDGKLQSTTGGHVVASWTAQSVTNNADGKPRPTSATVNGTSLAITFDRALDTSSKPAGSTFTLGGTTATVSSVAISGSTATLTLSAAVAHDAVVSVSYTKPGSVALKRSSKDIYTDSFSTYAVTNNTPDPTPTFSSASINAAGDALTITMTKNLLTTTAGTPAKSAFTLTGGSAAITAVAVSGKTAKLTISPKADNGETITIAYTKPTGTNAGKLQSKTGGHLVASWSAQSVTNGADGKPRPQSASVNGTTLAITFDRALDTSSVPAKADFALGGTSASVSSLAISGSSATLTLSAAVAHDAVLTLSYTKPGSGGLKRSGQEIYTDSFTALKVTNNTPDPTPTFSSASINAAGGTLTITMTKNLLTTTAGTPAKSAFTLTGGSAAITAVVVSGKTVTLTLSPKADNGETITVAYAKPTGSNDGKLQSKTGGHLVASWSAQSVSNNADGKPRPTSATVNGPALTITFDRALDAVSKPAGSTFTLAGTTATVSSVAISGSTATLTLSAAVAHDAVVTLSYVKPSTGGLKRSGKAIYTDSFTALKVTNNTPDPTPTFSSASINAAGGTLSITMSGALLETSVGQPAASAFTLSGGSAAVSAVSISGTTISLTLSPRADLSETITVAYTQPIGATDGKLQSLSGGHLVGTWSAQSVINNADGVPRPTAAVVNGASLTITFDRPLDAMSKPAAAAFSLGGTTASVSTVAIAGSTVTLTLSAAVAHDDVVTVTYTKPETGRIKRSGQALFAASFSSMDVNNVTPEPLIRSVTGDEDEIVILFSQELDTTSAPGVAAFSLGDDAPTVSTVDVGSVTVSLGLCTDLSEGGEYTLSYTKPTDSPLKTSDDAEVPSFSEAVTNVTDVAPLVDSVIGNGSTVSIEFDQPLDAEAALSASAFTVSASPAVSVDSAAYEGDDGLELTLSRSLVEDESVSVRYVQPTSGGIADPGGLRTNSFVLSVDNQTDTAPVPASGTVTDDEIVIILDQELFDDPRFHDMDGYPPDHFTLTGTDAKITFVQVSNGGPDGVGKIVITLSQDVDELETVLARYFPSSGTIRIRDDDPGKNRAEINNYQLTNLTRTPPTPETETLDGAGLMLVFDRTLDSETSVDAAWFSFKGDALRVESASLSGSTVSLVVSPPATEDAEYELTYTPPDSDGLASASGVAALGFTEEVTNTTDYAPFAVSASAEATGTVVGADEIKLLFDQRLDPAGTKDKSWFEFTPALEIKTVVVGSEGDHLLIELEAGHWVREGASVELKYTQPNDDGLRDDDGDPEVEDDGNLVASFTIDIQNNVDVSPQLVSATVDRDQVTLEFDQALDSDEDHVPPPNCKWLEETLKSFECPTVDPPTWFTVERKRAGADLFEDASIASVGVSVSTVTLSLEERINRGDEVRLSYQVESVEGGKWNLRDTTRVENIVDSFDSIDVENITAAAPTGKTFSRDEPSMIIVTFDGELKEGQTLNADPLSVTADEEPLTIREVSAKQTNLTVELQNEVPECAALAVSYTPEHNSWLDQDDRPIVAFNFDVANLIDATHGLACIESDLGALVLSFATDATISDQGWSLSVNEEARQIEVYLSADNVRLVPDAAVCVGDSLAISWTPPGKSELTLSRVVERAAPCVVSAVSVEDRLRVTFDQALDSSLPDGADFSIDRGGRVNGVAGIEGDVLTLQLEPPGIDADADATLSYAGSSLRGGGLTVGGFAIPITDLTEPPELTTAFGLGELVVLSFDQPLRQRDVPVSRFELVGPDMDIEIASVTVSGSSVYLQLTRSLPDEPDLFGVVYIARGTRGLAGASGVLVPSGVFLVENYTETPPTVVSVAVNARKVVATLDQRIDAADALTTDFVVIAGHRVIGIDSLEWSKMTITLTLAEPVTSLDSTRLTYSPGAEGTVRDLSGLPLAAFEMAAENLTPRAKTDEQALEEAKLRASGGATSVERELARVFASEDGARFAALPGDGAATVVLGGMRMTVDLSQWSEGEIGVSMSRVRSTSRLMRLLEGVPPGCAKALASSRVEGWLLEVQNRHGAPRVEGVEVTLGGLEAARLLGGCVLDLIAGSWTLMPLDGKVAAPSLFVPGPSTGFRSLVSLTRGA